MNTVRVCITLALLGLGGRFTWAAEGPRQPSATNISYVTASEAAKLVATNIVVIDVRTPGEFSKGRVAGARLVDISRPDFEQQLQPLDKHRTYLVLCQSGGRSLHALKSFTKLGFKSVIHLNGGMNAWDKAGQPVQK